MESQLSGKLPDAVVAVIVHNGRVLLIQRSPRVVDAGFWAPLSGKVERGENHEDTIIREVREEVGLTVRPVRKVWECVSANGTHTLHWWLAEYLGGEVTPEPREVSNFRWIEPAAFRACDDTFDCDREFFERVWPAVSEGVR